MTATFTKEQLLFFSELILTAAFDCLSLPHDCDLDERKSLFCYFSTDDPLRKLTDFERGAMHTAGMALASLYASQTDEGMAIEDALVNAGDFYEICENFICYAWSHWREVKAKAQPNSDIASYYEGRYPDVAHHARIFVDNCWEDSSQDETPKTE